MWEIIRISNDELRATNYENQNTNYELRATKYENGNIKYEV